jgi:hypothetical protein
MEEVVGHNLQELLGSEQANRLLYYKKYLK